LAGGAARRDRTAHGRGLRAYLPRHTPIAPLASLIETEQICCQFLTFTLTIGIDVTGPEGAEKTVDSLLGAPA
jgi:hypothetical protein